MDQSMFSRGKGVSARPPAPIAARFARDYGKLATEYASLGRQSKIREGGEHEMACDYFAAFGRERRPWWPNDACCCQACCWREIRQKGALMLAVETTFERLRRTP